MSTAGYWINLNLFNAGADCSSYCTSLSIFYLLGDALTPSLTRAGFIDLITVLRQFMIVVSEF